jgi:hypothetical protein
MAVTPSNNRNDPLQNQLLAALSADALTRLEPNLTPVHLALGQVIYEPDQTLQEVYFPTTAIVSLLYTMENGTSAEMGVVGCDGVVGIAVFMGGDTTGRFPLRVTVLSRRVQARRGIASSAPALHTSPSHSDVADRGV